MTSFTPARGQQPKERSSIATPFFLDQQSVTPASAVGRGKRAAGHAGGQWFDKTGSRRSSKKRKPSDARLDDTEDDTNDPFDQPTSIGAVTLMRVVSGFPACAGMQSRTLR